MQDSGGLFVCTIRIFFDNITNLFNFLVFLNSFLLGYNNMNKCDTNIRI